MNNNYTTIFFPGLGIEWDPGRMLELGPLKVHFYGLLIALVSVITKGKFPKKKSFSCEGCPSAGLCRTGACQKGDEQ